MTPRSLILASLSPRRSELLSTHGFSFQVVEPAAEEIHDTSLSPAALTQWNARLKAASVAQKEPETIVIGADTLVYIDDIPLGKPADHHEARRMLQKLSGREHSVTTGVAILQGDLSLAMLAITTHIWFRELTHADIQAYHERCNPLDKAGGYGIQTASELILDHYEGSLSNVIGLPVDEVAACLASFGITKCF